MCACVRALSYSNTCTCEPQTPVAGLVHGPLLSPGPHPGDLGRPGHVGLDAL